MLMYGYASSADSSGSCAAAEITVLFTDDFVLADPDCKIEIYRFCRERQTIDKVFPHGESHFGLPYEIIAGVYKLLHAEELKFNDARRIMWKCSADGITELLKSELLPDVWLPVPAINGECSCLCLNVTPCFFPGVPKPLEASMLCDMLNIGFMRAGIRVATPFYNCFGSVYCSADFAKVASGLCGLDLAAAVTKPEHKELLQKHMHKLPKLCPNKKQIAHILKNEQIPASRFQGSEHSFALDIKRECIAHTYSAISESVLSCDPTPIVRISDYIDKQINRFKILSEVFVLGGSIYSSSDILYLTFYELMSAFAFYEDRLSLKKKIANSKARQAALGKLNAPTLVLPNGTVLS